MIAVHLLYGDPKDGASERGKGTHPKRKFDVGLMKANRNERRREES